MLNHHNHHHHHQLGFGCARIFVYVCWLSSIIPQTFQGIPNSHVDAGAVCFRFFGRTQAPWNMGTVKWWEWLGRHRWMVCQWLFCFVRICFWSFWTKSCCFLISKFERVSILSVMKAKGLYICHTCFECGLNMCFCICNYICNVFVIMYVQVCICNFNYIWLYIYTCIYCTVIMMDIQIFFLGRTLLACLTFFCCSLYSCVLVHTGWVGGRVK